MDRLIPLFPLDLVLLPDAPLPLHIFEPRYREMVGECLRDRKEFGIVRVKNAPRGKQQGIEEYGCTAEIVDVLRSYPDGRMDIIVIGRRRFEIVELNDTRSFFQAEVEFIEDEDADVAADPQLRESVKELHAEVLMLISSEVTQVDENSDQLSFQLMAALPVDLDFKQTFLEMRSEEQRMRTLLEYYTKILPQLKTLSFGQKRSGTNGWVN
jgi:Lon protease-like protein